MAKGAPRNPRLVAEPLLAGERGGLAAALKRTGLPADDVEEPGRLFWRFVWRDVPVGFGGLEIHGKDALLRSVVALPPVRGQGIGRAIVAALEAEAEGNGCRTVWLLTNSNPAFFERLGYLTCERTAMPESIRATPQFISLCPANANAMMKKL